MSAEFEPDTTVIESGPFKTEDGERFMTQYIIKPALHEMDDAGILVRHIVLDLEITSVEL